MNLSPASHPFVKFSAANHRSNPDLMGLRKGNKVYLVRETKDERGVHHVRGEELTIKSVTGHHYKMANKLQVRAEDDSRVITEDNVDLVTFTNRKTMLYGKYKTADRDTLDNPRAMNFSYLLDGDPAVDQEAEKVFANPRNADLVVSILRPKEYVRFLESWVRLHSERVGTSERKMDTVKGALRAIADIF